MNALITEARRRAPNALIGVPVVYFLRLRSGAIYVGTSAELAQRLEDHGSGRACRTTALDEPAELLRVEVCGTYGEASRREAQIKRWSRAKKEALVRGDGARLKQLSRSHDGPR